MASPASGAALASIIPRSGFTRLPGSLAFFSGDARRWNLCTNHRAGRLKSPSFRPIRCSSGRDSVSSGENSSRFFELNTGAKIPAVGLGTYKAEPGVVEASIIAAVKVLLIKAQFSGGRRLLSPIPLPVTFGSDGGSDNLAVALGLTTRASPSSQWMPGTYPGSIGFQSDGSLYLDGNKMASESEKAKCAVVGCRFDPRKKVFFIVDSQLSHVMRCSSKEYSNPLLPVQAAKVEVSLLINVG